MNVEELREYCLSLPKVEENQPWTEPQYEMLVTYKVGGKWFVPANLEEKFIDLKYDPELIADLKSHYKGAFPAWHMNKSIGSALGWNQMSLIQQLSRLSKMDMI